jgi:hypothetical protein
MRSLFTKPKPFLDAPRREWQFAVFTWLLRHCGGYPKFLDTTLVLPIESHFPDRGLSGHAAVAALFRRVRDHAGMADWPCTVEPESNEARVITGLSDRIPVITYKRGELAAMSMVGAFAHELSRMLVETFEEPPPGGAALHEPAIDLAAHEGYPGHHVYNALLEKNLVRNRGWKEFTVYALFSPQSLIAEGTANFGKEVVFTKAERLKFEQEVIFPAAGLDPKLAAEYYAVQEMTEQLSYAANEAARRLLDGEIDAAAAAAWLEKFALLEPKRAQQRVRFIEQYRSYVINYNLGEDMVRTYVEKRGGTVTEPEKRWQIFTELLSTPRVPNGLE